MVLRVFHFPLVKPQITSKTTGPVTINEGQRQTLECTASGNPKPTITWYKDNVELTLNDPSKTDYIISSAQRKDQGTYRCVASVTGGNLGPYTEEYSVFVDVKCKFCRFEGEIREVCIQCRLRVREGTQVRKMVTGPYPPPPSLR